MSTPSRHGIAYTLFALIALCLAGLGVRYLITYEPGGRIPQEQYLRAVFVLQSMGGPASSEPETIPARIERMDETESLLRHPDRILVLRRIADDLEEVRPTMPKAALFEAYARIALGQRGRAAALLNAYVVDAPYNAAHYALLCDLLHGEGEDSALLMIVKEWQERDRACRDDRARYAWTALYNLGRYAESEETARRQSACLGWRASVLRAKSLMAEEREEEAAELLDAAIERYPNEALHIRRLWEQLKGRLRV